MSIGSASGDNFYPHMCDFNFDKSAVSIFARFYLLMTLFISSVQSVRSFYARFSNPDLKLNLGLYFKMDI